MTQVELQQDVQRFTSDFVGRIAEAGRQTEQVASPEQREIALRRVLIYASNALDIATGPFPEINLVDMLVFVSLSRHAFQHYWQPKVFDGKAQEFAATFVAAEERLWGLSNKILSGDQQVQLREMIVEWERANPDRYSVEGVRFQEFSSRAGAVSEERAAKAHGMFGQLKSATQTADQALLISERAMYLAQRMPFLVRAHARLAVQESVSDSLDRLGDLDRLLARAPAMRPMLNDLVSISNNAATAARETRLLMQASEPYLEFVAPYAHDDDDDERVGVRGEAEEHASLVDVLTRVDRISERSLSLVRELRASVPADPHQAVMDVERRVDGLARRIALYALIVGVGWAVVFWSGYYLVKRR